MEFQCPSCSHDFKVDARFTEQEGRKKYRCTACSQWLVLTIRQGRITASVPRRTTGTVAAPAEPAAEQPADLRAEREPVPAPLRPTNSTPKAAPKPRARWILPVVLILVGAMILLLLILTGLGWWALRAYQQRPKPVPPTAVMLDPETAFAAATRGKAPTADPTVAAEDAEPPPQAPNQDADNVARLLESAHPQAPAAEQVNADHAKELEIGSPAG